MERLEVAEEQSRRGPGARRLTTLLAASLGVATLLAACGGGGALYTSKPTASCLKQQGHHVQVSEPQPFESHAGIVGAVETEIKDYVVDVVFLKSTKDAQRDFATVAASEKIDLGGTPAADKEAVKRVLTSHDYVLRNARVRWRGGTTAAVPDSLLHGLNACLRS